MNYRKFFCLAFAGGLLCALPCSAADIYVAQSAQGADTGADAADAHSVAWLNTSTNWGAGSNKIGPGGTVHLCGIVSNSITIQASGAAGNPITIYFEPNASMIATNWPPAFWYGGGAITIISKNYITVDGGSNGLIAATANGTGLLCQTNCCGVGAVSASYLTVKNLTIKNMYVRTNNTEQNGNRGFGIQDACTQPPGFVTGFTVTNCTISDAFVGISANYAAGCSNYTFIGNTISRCNWGGNAGDMSSAATLANLVVANNTILTFSNWDDMVGNTFHHNGFFGWANIGGGLNGVQVYGNRIGPDFGKHATSGIFFQGNVTNAIIYNNVFLENTNDSPGNGLITATGHGESQIYNNTFIGVGSGIAIYTGTTSATNIVKNNLAVGCATYFGIFYASNSTLIADYNMGYNLKAGSEYCYSKIGSAVFMTFAPWLTRGYDNHGSASLNPLMNSDGTLKSGSPAILAGANLSSIFTTDYTGKSRPATGNWTIGAYEYTTNAPPAISAPNGLTVVPQ